MLVINVSRNSSEIPCISNVFSVGSGLNNGAGNFSFNRLIQRVNDYIRLGSSCFNYNFVAKLLLLSELEFL